MHLLRRLKHRPLYRAILYPRHILFDESCPGSDCYPHRYQLLADVRAVIRDALEGRGNGAESEREGDREGLFRDAFFDSKEDLRLELIDRIVNEIYAAVKDKKNEIVQLILSSERPKGDKAANDINCAVIAIIIGINMKLVGHKILSLATAALLHDVGMYRIPDNILNKKEELTQKEVSFIRTHPVHSYTIISKELKYPEEIAQIALYHHERWDGKGYIHPLAGQDIPLEARIVAIADVYDALTTERVYKEAFSEEVAEGLIAEESGTHFDPELVEIFLANKLTIREIKSSLS